MTKIKYFTYFLGSLLLVGLFYLGLLSTNKNVRAAETCTSTQTGDWDTASTWTSCASTVPQVGDSVVIANTHTVTIPSSHTINAVVDITIQNGGTLSQNNTNTQTISGTLTIESGGTFTHGNNSSSHANEIDFVAANVDIQSGGTIDVDALGFDGSQGPAEPLSADSAGGGGSHGGNGGDSQTFLSTRTGFAVDANCDISNPSTLGSGGGGRNGSIAGSGSQGGGFIKLTVSGTTTINGTITADGAAGNGGSSSFMDGGGAGGGINISTVVIDGTPTAITLTGGAGASGSQDGGSGGGGCMLLSYTTDAGSSGILNAANVSMDGGADSGGGLAGGAGVYLVKTPSTNGTLFIDGSPENVESSQAASTLTVDVMNITDGGAYSIPDGNTLTLVSSTALSHGDDTGLLVVKNGGTIAPPTTFSVASTTIQFHLGGVWTNAATTNLTLGTSSTLDMRYFTTSSAALTFSSFTIDNLGLLTHGTNTTTHAHIVHVGATTMSINAGGKINVDAKGYADGQGPAPGGGEDCAGGGGAHGGDGGASEFFAGCQSDGGTAYATSTDPDTIELGSGGDGRNGSTAGDGSQGGGMIKLNVSGTLTINGTITADGVAGNNATGGYSDGGGAGGGLHVTTGLLNGTPESLTLTGGNGHEGGIHGGGGGGGAVYVGYTSTAYETSDFTVTGGTSADGTAGSVGFVSMVQLNSDPTATDPSFTTSTDGTGNVTIVTTLDDADDNVLSMKTEALSGSCETYSGQTTTTLNATVQSTYGSLVVDNASSTGFQIGDITTASGANTVTTTWESATDFPTGNGTYCIFITPNDTITDGAVASSTVVIDNVDPTTPGALTVSATSTNNITFAFGSQSSDTNFDEYLLIGNTGATAPIVDSSDIEFNKDTNTSLSLANYNGESTIVATGLNTSTQYTFNIAAGDTYENYASSTALTLYTLADTPGAPTMGTSTTSSLAITIDTATNPSSVTYAIYNETDSMYLDAAGAASTSPVYQTTSTWGSIVATGLSGNTSYQFTVVGRNGDNVSTATSTASTATYTAANVPTSLAAVATSRTSVTVSWTGDGTSYTINDGSSNVATGVTDTSRVISELTCNTTYSYRVKALNANSTESAFTNAVSVTTNACIDTSGGSHSSSKSKIPKGPLLKAPAETQLTIPAASGASRQVKVGNSEHTVTVLHLKNETVRLKIESDPVILDAKAGETYYVDSNSDGKEDLYIFIEKVTEEEIIFTAIAIEDLEFSINHAARTTDSRLVKLYINSPDATHMAISNSDDFSNTPYMDVAEEYDWELTKGSGDKTVYVKLRTAKGGSKVLHRTITLTSAGKTDPPTNISCALPLHTAYKAPDASAVFYITETYRPDGTIDTTEPCSKQAFTHANTYFTYYTSWNETKVVDADVLDAIPNSALGFMPQGPLYNPQYGAIVKTVHDPKVYLLLGDTRYWITSQEVYEALNYKWSWIEDVSQHLLDNYKEGSEITDTTTHPDHTLIKYAGNSKVYKLEHGKKRWISSPDAFEKLGYRWDRIVTVPDTETYQDGTKLE